MLIGFVGLSHLGLITSVVTASKGYKVISYDPNKKRISQFKKGLFDINEPNLNKFYKKYNKKIVFTSNVKDLYSCDIVYFAEDIKTNQENISDLKSYKKFINKILEKLNRKSIVIILSQVPPGFSRNIIWEEDKLFYQVETLIFGKAIERSMSPERIIVGSKNKNNIPQIYKNLLKKYKCPIIIMDYESAELTKISINLYLISQISLTNILSHLVNNLDGNWENIRKSLQLDKRIGKHSYLKPGLGISGGNLERDLVTIQETLRKYNIKTKLFKEHEKISNFFNNWPSLKLTEVIKKYNIKNPIIGIMGLTYKKNTDSLKNSPAIKFIKNNKKYKKIVYDPVIKKIKNNNNLKFVKSINNLILKSSILVVMNDWDEFTLINLKTFKMSKTIKVIIDPLGILKKHKLNNHGFIYKSLSYNK